MAYAFCIAKAYADDVIARGLPVDEFAGRLSYNFNIFGNLFEQVAKFRAGRSLWAKIMKEQYEARDPGSMWLRMIAGGKRLSEIAEALAISPKTVSVYRARVLEKLKLRTNTELARYAVANELVE